MGAPMRTDVGEDSNEVEVLGKTKEVGTRWAESRITSLAGQHHATVRGSPRELVEKGDRQGYIERFGCGELLVPLHLIELVAVRDDEVNGKSQAFCYTSRVMALLVGDQAFVDNRPGAQVGGFGLPVEQCAGRCGN